MWLMNGTQVSSSTSLGMVATSWSVVGTGDFDGDGKFDILWRKTDGSLAMWLLRRDPASTRLAGGAR